MATEKYTMRGYTESTGSGGYSHWLGRQQPTPGAPAAPPPQGRQTTGGSSFVLGGNPLHNGPQGSNPDGLLGDQLASSGSYGERAMKPTGGAEEKSSGATMQAAGVAVLLLIAAIVVFVVQLRSAGRPRKAPLPEETVEERYAPNGADSPNTFRFSPSWDRN
jgi:hypothetical protein